MAWQQLVISTTAESAEIVGDLLEQHQAQSITFADAKDTPLYEPDPNEVEFWPDTQVIGLYSDQVDLQPVIDAISATIDTIEQSQITVTKLEDKDWTRAWMDDFHPMQFGKRLWICPSWLTPPDSKAVNIMLDPGLAFGTGTHPTTAMCLTLLENLDLTGKSVTDFGCGSGILGIAALKLGAIKVNAVDIDSQALLATRLNAEKNNICEGLNIYFPEEHPREETDVVIANILAGPLIDLKSTLQALCKNNGIIILSGILKEQSDKIVDAYDDHCMISEIHNAGEWTSIVASKI